MPEQDRSEIDELLKHKDKLSQRLQKGRMMIRTEQDKGSEKADSLFEYWLSLLTDYEQTIDRLRVLGVDEAELNPDAGAA